MPSTAPDRRLPFARRERSDTTLVESPTHIVQRLLRREGSERPKATNNADTADTIAVMLRVLPPPHLLLSITDADLRKRLRSTLQHVDFHLQEAISPVDAEQIFTATRCPLVLTDSLQLLKRLRELTAARFAHLIYAVRGRADWEAARRAGADDLIDSESSTEAQLARLKCARRLADLEGGLRVALQQNHRLSTTDELTGVANRRFFARFFPRELLRAKRQRHPLTVLMCDIDHFKRVNDSHGHAIGDAVLRDFGRCLQAGLRRGIDWVVRLGGEEFAIVLPDTDLRHALEIARRLRERVAEQHFGAPGQSVQVTASFGLCAVGVEDLGRFELAEQLLEAADRALYHSKDHGRDRITVARLRPTTESAAASKGFTDG